MTSSDSLLLTVVWRTVVGRTVVESHHHRIAITPNATAATISKMVKKKNPTTSNPAATIAVRTLPSQLEGPQATRCSRVPS